MGYSLGPQQSLRLEKFTPREAVAIFRVIAETEDLPCDEDFVQEVTEQELTSREDGLISAVDLQILAWMIRGQKSAEERAFNRTAFQKLGGLEGLLERFLSRALQARETEARRQGALQVLLALTDMERSARAGVLSAEDVEKKLAGTVAPEEVQEALEWLVRGDVRLATPVEREDGRGYELAHERLIPALRRLAGKELSAADQANQLLDRRVKEWMGNNRTRRYLLSWRDWRLIQRQSAFLLWGVDRRQKEVLLAQTQRYWRRCAEAASLVVLLLVSVIAWWYSPCGQMQLLDRQVQDLRARIHDGWFLSNIAELRAVKGQWSQAFDIVEEITDPSAKTFALGEIARRAVELPDLKAARRLWGQALKATLGIDDPETKTRALGEISSAVWLADEENAKELWAQVLQATAAIKDPEVRGNALTTIALREGRGFLLNIVANGLRAELVRTAQDIQDTEARTGVLSALATETAEVLTGAPDPESWKEALQVAERIDDVHARARALSEIARLVIRRADPATAHNRATEVILAAQRIGALDAKTLALNLVATTLATVAAIRNDPVLWTSALQAIDAITDPALQALALTSVANIAAYHYYLGRVTRGIWKHITGMDEVRGYFARAREIASGITVSEVRSSALQSIAEAENIDADTRRLVALVSSPFTSTLAFSMVSSSALTVAEESQNPARWAQAVQVAKLITTIPIILNPAYGDVTKGFAMPTVLGEAAKVGGRIAAANGDTALFEQALDLASDIEDQEIRSEALRTIVESISLMAQRRADTALAVRALTVALRLPRPEPDRLTHSDERYGASSDYTANTVNDQRSRALASVAKAFLSFARAKYDSQLLDQATGIADEIIEPNNKAEVLSAIAGSMAFIASEREDRHLLARALGTAERIKQPFHKDNALGPIAYAAAILGDWGEAISIARQCSTDTEKGRTLSRILVVWVERSNEDHSRPKPG